MVQVASFMQTEMYTKETGKTMKHQVLEYSIIQTEQNTKETG